MKNYILIFCLILFISCDDKIESLEKLNKMPVVEYFSRNTINWTEIEGKIVDSAKVNNTKNNALYSIALRSKDVNNNFEDIEIKEIISGGDFFINDQAFKDVISVELDSFSLSYRYPNKDVRLFSVKSADDFGKIQNIEFEIHFLENVIPEPNFEIRNQNESGITEHIIDASFSKDGDFNRGGFIINYEYSIDGILINSANSKITHVFNKGTHQIGLRVQDNDEVYSEQIIKTLVIN